MCRRVIVLGLCVCPSVTALAATYLVCRFKVRVLCSLLKICAMWTSLKMFCSGDIAYFACNDDRQLGSLSTRNTPTVFDMTTTGIMYEPLAKSDDYRKIERLSLSIFASMFCGSFADSLIMTSAHDLLS